MLLGGRTAGYWDHSLLNMSKDRYIITRQSQTSIHAARHSTNSAAILILTGVLISNAWLKKNLKKQLG